MSKKTDDANRVDDTTNELADDQLEQAAGGVTIGGCWPTKPTKPGWPLPFPDPCPGPTLPTIPTLPEDPISF